MHLIFFDECKPQRDHPYYHIGAISIAEESFESIEKRVNDIARDVFGEVLLKRTTEFHAVDIFHGNKTFKNKPNVPERLEVLVRLLEILMLPEVYLIRIRINTSKLYNPLYADAYAFMFLCERANSFMKARKTIGMLIGDRESDSNSERFSTSLSQYRAKGTNYQYGEEITNLFESVHFTHSHLSRFLQLADAYAWYLQFQKRNQINRRPQNEPFFELLRSREISLSESKYKIWPS